MYAVFRSGGKQYRASQGERLKLEKLPVAEGADVSFDEVLLLGEGSDVKVGDPLLVGSSVSAKVLKQGKSKKVSVVKFRRRKNYLRQHTHRQFFTEVEITAISGDTKDNVATGKGEEVRTNASEKPSVKKVVSKKPAAKKAATKKPAAKKAASKKSSGGKTVGKKTASTKKKVTKKVTKKAD